MPGHRVFTYSLGDVANNLSFMMTSMFLMVFMTEIAGLTAAAAGMIYGVTKVWAGIADLIVGQTADRVDTRWGRLRPFLLFGSTPLAIVFVLLFSVPAGLSMTVTIVWILLFDAAFQLAYSFVNIPYGSLSAAMTQDPVDRSKLSGARSIASSITAVALSAVISPQFQDTTADGVRLKFTITCLILGVIAVILYLICFANSREVVPRKPGKISFKATFRMLKQNRPLLILCLGAFFLLSAMFTQMAVGVYYARYVLGNAAWYTFLMFANTVGTILIASLVPMLTARLGKRKGYIACAVVYMVGFVFIFFLPSGSLPLGILARLLMGIGAFGYVAMAGEQTESAQQGIRIATGLLPAGLTLLAVIVVFFYPLSAELHSKVVTDLNERRTQSNVATRKGVSSDRVKVETVGDGRNTLMRSADGHNPPVITVFGQRGSGASDIAPKIAEALGVKYIGQKFTSDELAQVDRRDLISDNGFDRFLRQVSLGGTQNTELAAATNIASNRQIAAENTDFVLDAVDCGGVILGRNGALVLGKVVGAMHVRLIAPIGKRVERVMDKTGLSAAEAAEQCAPEGRIRSEMARALYHFDPNDDENYDIVINTASVTYDQVVEIIVDLYRSKYPNNLAVDGNGQ